LKIGAIGDEGEAIGTAVGLGVGGLVRPTFLVGAAVGLLFGRERLEQDVGFTVL